MKKRTSDFPLVSLFKEWHTVAVAVERLSYRRIPRAAKRNRRGVCARKGMCAPQKGCAQASFCTTLYYLKKKEGKKKLLG